MVFSEISVSSDSEGNSPRTRNLVHGAVFAPVDFCVLDPLGGDEGGLCHLSDFHVRGFQRRNVDGVPEAPPAVERLVKVAGQCGRVPEQQHPGVVRCHRSLDGFEYPLSHAGRLVHHKEDVPFVKALEPLRRVRREAQRVVLVVKLERGPEQFAPDEMLVPVVDAPDLAPEHVSDLVLRRRGCDDK